MIPVRKTGEKGRTLIKARETLRLLAYDDKQPWLVITNISQVKGKLTNGYGHTGPDVFVGQVITEAQADAWFEEDLAKREVQLAHLLNVSVTPNEWDALMCLMYNIGSGNLSTSTLLRKLNKGDKAGAAAQFLAWRFDDGEESKGLLKRRTAEKQLFEQV